MTDLQPYDSLEKTATDWVTSTRPQTPGSNDPDFDHIRSLLAPNAILRFGHMHFVSTAPHLQRDESPDDFVNRLKSMSPALQTWRIDVADVNVDVKKKSAVVRAVFHMQAKGDPEVLQNEILFWCQMDEEGGKILQSTEFVDPAALQALGPKLKAAKMANGS
jgi:ketosteroid isomerase-like protein